MAEQEVLVDPEVSRAKFTRELQEYRKLEDEHIARGWLMLRAEYPEVYVVFAALKIKPSAIIFGAKLDFSNYDLWPPSVQLVDPFTKEAYKYSQLPTRLLRQVTVPGQMAGLQIQELMQAHEDDKPFLCLPGVREYHEHPAHTGDSWLLHRGGAEGTLFFLLNTLYQYGVEPISGYQFNIQITVGGYTLSGLSQ